MDMSVRLTTLDFFAAFDEELGEPLDVVWVQVDDCVDILWNAVNEEIL